MDWDMFWTMLITGGTSLIVAILGRLMSRNDDPEQVLDPKWAEIVDILPISELKWLSFQLDLGLQQPHGHGGLIEHMEFFSLVRKVLYMREAEERGAELDLLYAKPPESGDYVEERTVAGPTRYIPLDYTQWDAEYGKTLNEKRSA